MNEQRQGVILADCIERLQTGESVTDCLAHYGADAADMAPLLSAAVRLQRLQNNRLSPDQRGRAKATLRAALFSQNQRSLQPAKMASWRLRLGWPASSRSLASAGLLAVTLFVGGAFTAVAASQPGDLAYPVRVIAERAPVLLNTTDAARATTELHIADRRLADLNKYLAATGRIEHDALAALLSGDQSAANLEVTASEAERAAVAARVMAHADALTSMASATTETQTRTALQTAAEQALAIAAGLEPDPSRPVASPTPMPMSPTPTTDILIAQPTPTATGGKPQGTHTAQAVQTPQGTGTQAAQGTHTPQGMHTAQATQTPGDGQQGTHTPQTIRTAQPTQTPGYGQQPSATPKPTQTPGYGQQPSATPKPTQTPGQGQQPSATPKPTQTPGQGQQPSATPKPTQTPGNGQQPTATPKPTQTPGHGQQPTATPQPRRTAQATRTPGGGGSGR